MARAPVRPAGTPRAWWSGGVTVLAVLAMPMLLLFQFVRTPTGLLAWAVDGLWMATLLGVVVGGRDRDGNSRIDASLGRVALAAVTALALQVLVAPEQALFLVPVEAYPPAQVMAGVALVGCGVWWWLWVRDVVLPDRPVVTVADAVVSSGRIPAARRGRRRPRRLPATPGTTFVGRLQSAVATRAAVLVRYAALLGLTVVLGVISLVISGGAFVEGWAGVAVGLALLAEERVRAWRRENVLSGFDEPDPDAGRLGYDAWVGLSAGWLLASASSASLRLGGVRPEPLWLYALALGLAVAASVGPWQLIRDEPERWFAAWLERSPQRLDELGQVRAAWPASRLDEFGEWPLRSPAETPRP